MAEAEASPIPYFVRSWGPDDAEKQSQEFAAYSSLEVARTHQGSIVIMQGDHGGQIYLTHPVCLTLCSSGNLRDILNACSDACWGRDDEYHGEQIYFEKLLPGSRVSGGMGGGEVQSDLWIHPELMALGVFSNIRLALSGQAPLDLRPFLAAKHRRHEELQKLLETT